MDDWLRHIVRFAVFLVIAGIGWYIYQARQVNFKKNPELAEEMNKKRIAQNLRPLTVEDLRKVVRKKNIISSVIFSITASCGYFLVDLLLS
ncbi:MAG: hypothetical protein FWC32_00410, partial [Firmicutes bacterium]|nr:hypothetical protein [Bacillota bacterium]